jgi:HK97 family phage prohead protease
MKEVREKHEHEIRRYRSAVTMVGNEESRQIEGYALLFDTASDGLSYEEVIERGALEGVLEKSDVKALLNHDLRRGVLARAKKGNGSLNLTVDLKGLKYSFEAPKTSLGDELLENIRRGEIDESSFAFTIADEEWERTSTDSAGYSTWKRTIKKFNELYDVSPVYDAAYSETSVYLRGKQDKEEELRKAQEPPEEGKKEPVEPEPAAFVPEAKNYKTVPFTF